MKIIVTAILKKKVLSLKYMLLIPCEEKKKDPKN